jgi:hypothetical protein
METIRKVKHKGNYLKQRINGYPVEIGVLDVEDATSCFINFGGYVNGNTELNDLMKRFQRKLRFWVDDAANQLFKDKLNTRMPIIKNVEWSDSITSITNNSDKFTYFSIELTLFWKDVVDIRDTNQADGLLLLCYSLADYLDENRCMSFRPTRN